MAFQKVKLPYRVNGWVNGYGQAQYRLRLPGQKSIALPGLPWSPEFMAAHAAAMAGQTVPAKQAAAIGAARTRPGTLNDAIVRFYAHELFTDLGRAHQMRHRQKLESFRQEITADNVPRGERQLATLTHDRLAKIVKDIPSAHAQRHLLNALRSLMRFCKLTQLVQTDPTDGLKGKRRTAGGFKPWDESDIVRYRAHHALGTMPRLALELMLNTGARRSDAVRLGRQHIQHGRLTFKPQKTANVTGIVVNVKVHPDLQAAIDAMPPALTFLTNSYGKPFTVAGFGNWFRDQCMAAGVMDVRAHGLRKAICIRLVAQGMSPHQIAAITGHKDLREIQVYADAFNRQHAGDQAMDALIKSAQSG
jgi:integrase